MNLFRLEKTGFGKFELCGKVTSVECASFIVPSPKRCVRSINGSGNIYIEMSG